MDTHDLAWAAGFFDGEGWAAAKQRGVQSRINQAGPDGVPEVLLKFRRIVGVGRIKGPVLEEGKQPLYFWEATSLPDLTRVADLIGTWMCPAKRAEFESALRLQLPPVVWPGSTSEDLAWAGKLQAFASILSVASLPKSIHEAFALNGLIRRDQSCNSCAPSRCSVDTL